MRSLLPLTIAASFLAVFALDAVTVLGLADWVLYLVPLLLSARLSYRFAPAAVAAAIPPLIAAGYFLSPPGPIADWVAVTNRVVGAGMFGLVGGLLTILKFHESERESLVGWLRAANEDLTALSRVTENAVGSLDTPQMLGVLVSRLKEVMGAEVAAVVLREEGEFRVAVSSPEGAPAAFEAAVAAAVTDRGPRYIPGGEAAAALGLPAGVSPPVWMGAPLRRNGTLVGALVLAWREPRANPDRDLHLLEITAERCAAALVNARLVADLRDSEARYRMLFEANPLPMWVYDTETLRFLAVNPAAVGAYGYSADEFLAMTILDIRPPEDEAAVRKSAATRFPGFRHSGPWRHRTKAGAEIEVELTSHGITFAGRPARLVLARDVTRQNRVARERDAATHRLRLILDRMPLACVVTDPDDRVIDWNPAAERTFGFTRAEVRGRTPAETFAPARGRAADTADTHMVGASATRDGRTIWCEWHTTLLYDGGVLVGRLAMAQDVTDRRKAEQALRALSRQVLTAQERERRAIARELHDEIGQVLTAVRINLQTLAGLCPPDARPVLEDSSAIVAEAIRQVRGMSLDLRPPMLDDFGLAAAVKWYAEQQARRAGLPIEVAGADAVPRLQAEQEAGCFRVAQEAVTNALRHAKPNRISVELAAADGELVLRVTDDGAGFDPAGSGEGFGLTGMRERAELLGGDLTITSTPGRGTAVALRVPLARRGGDAATGAGT